MNSLSLATPEIVLIVAAMAVLLLGLFTPSQHSGRLYLATQASLALTLLLVVMQDHETRVQTAFAGSYVADVMAYGLKPWILIVVIGGLLYARDYLNEHGIMVAEYYLLVLFGTAGMLVMVSAGNLLSVYLGLELLALSQYALVALNRDHSPSSEAAMKYFVLGALASGMLLYGISMLYGATGSLDLVSIHAAVAGTGHEAMVARFGLVFLIVGVAFKLGAVPFHMWVPDIYEGAPTPVTMFIATAPKIAAFAMLVRLLVSALEGIALDWQMMLSVLAALSMIVGNLVAIAQSNIKRMLAYSTISHVGFLLVGFIGANGEGYAASMFYAITYAFTTLAAFGVLLALSRQGQEAVLLEDLAGLARRNRLLAAVLALAMFSLAGVPPLVGFYAKLSVLKSAVDAGYVWLALIGVATSVVGAFYYLRVVKLVWFDEPGDALEFSAPGDVNAGLAVNGLMIVALGLMPGLIMNLCIAAFESGALLR